MGRTEEGAMTKLELISAVNQAAIEMRAVAGPFATHLMCPACAVEFTAWSDMAPDLRIVCSRRRN